MSTVYFADVKIGQNFTFHGDEYIKIPNFLYLATYGKQEVNCIRLSDGKKLFFANSVIVFSNNEMVFGEISIGSEFTFDSKRYIKISDTRYVDVKDVLTSLSPESMPVKNIG